MCVQIMGWTLSVSSTIMFLTVEHYGRLAIGKTIVSEAVVVKGYVTGANVLR